MNGIWNEMEYGIIVFLYIYNNNTHYNELKAGSRSYRHSSPIVCYF